MIKKLALPFLSIVALNFANAQCTTPLAIVNENFESFEESSFPQNCWTSSTTQTSVTDWYGDGNLAAFLLTGPGAQNPSYLVSPQISLSQAQTFTFDATGNATLQVGVMSSPTDYPGFIPIATCRIYPNKMQYHVVVSPTQTARHIAFKLIPAATTSHVVLDNVKLPSPLNCAAEASSFLQDFSLFASGSASQNCWVGSNDESYMTIQGTDVKSLIFVAEPLENVNELYFVSPKIIELTGNNVVSLRVSGADGQFEAGTVSSPYDFNSFIPSGVPIQIAVAPANHNIPVSGPAPNRYIAVKFSVAPGKESAIGRLRQISLNQPLSLPENEINTVKIYPNPADNILNISSESTITSATIHDMSGRQIMKTTSFPIAISHLNAGVYVIKVETAEGASTLKFVKE